MHAFAVFTCGMHGFVHIRKGEGELRTMEGKAGAACASLRIRNLVKTYRDGASEVTALALGEADFGAGEQWAVVGPSGCGKSTLLHCISGMIAPTKGVIETEAGNIVTFDEKALQQWRRRTIGYIFQEFNLIDALSAEENIGLGAYFGGMTTNGDYTSTVNRLLDAMEIGNLRHKKPKALSRGEQQRVAVARALVKGPGIVLADEPTASLDAENGDRVMSLLTAYCKEQGATLLVVTHEERIKAYFSNVLSLQKGDAHVV